MNIKAKLTMLVLVMVSFVSFSQAQLQTRETRNKEVIAGQREPTSMHFASSSIESPQDGNIRLAKRGDIASGLIVKSSDKEISVDIKPCEETSVIVTFREPYRKLEVGKGYCKGREITIVQIQQY